MSFDFATADSYRESVRTEQPIDSANKMHFNGATWELILDEMEAQDMGAYYEDGHPVNHPLNLSDFTTNDVQWFTAAHASSALRVSRPDPVRTPHPDEDDDPEAFAAFLPEWPKVWAAWLGFLKRAVDQDGFYKW